MCALFYMVSNSCTEPAGEEIPPKEQEQEFTFNWLLGDWIRISADTSSTTYEIWKRQSEKEYLGHGFVMQNNDTVWQEKMTLTREDTSWVFIVRTPGNSGKVRFPVKSLTEKTFQAENLNHDFPKTITYRLEEDTLYANVAGGENNIDFVFRNRKKGE
jgi:hypothetical protein